LSESRNFYLFSSSFISGSFYGSISAAALSAAASTAAASTAATSSSLVFLQPVKTTEQQSKTSNISVILLLFISASLQIYPKIDLLKVYSILSKQSKLKKLNYIFSQHHRNQL
jgi:hypothetical protein